MSKIQILHSTYDRMYSTDNNKTVITGASIRSCLLEAADVLGLYVEAQDILDEEEENGKKYTDDELAERLNDAYGDGCDFIYQIVDLETGDVIYDSGEECEGTCKEYTSKYDNY